MGHFSSLHLSRKSITTIKCTILSLLVHFGPDGSKSGKAGRYCSIDCSLSCWTYNFFLLGCLSKRLPIAVGMKFAHQILLQ